MTHPLKNVLNKLVADPARVKQLFNEIDSLNQHAQRRITPNVDAKPRVSFARGAKIAQS